MYNVVPSNHFVYFSYYYLFFAPIRHYLIKISYVIFICHCSAAVKPTLLIIEQTLSQLVRILRFYSVLVCVFVLGGGAVLQLLVCSDAYLPISTYHHSQCSVSRSFIYFIFQMSEVYLILLFFFHWDSISTNVYLLCGLFLKLQPFFMTSILTAVTFLLFFLFIFQFSAPLSLICTLPRRCTFFC